MTQDYMHFAYCICKVNPHLNFNLRPIVQITQYSLHYHRIAPTGKFKSGFIFHVQHAKACNLKPSSSGGGSINNNNNSNNNNNNAHTAETAIVKVKNIFQGEITLHVAQIVNTEELQPSVRQKNILLFCFGYIIVNTLHKDDHKDDDDDDDDNNNNNNNNGGWNHFKIIQTIPEQRARKAQN